MPLNAFLDLLLSDARGVSFACNMVDSVEIALFPPAQLKSLMASVLAEFEVDKANVKTSIEAIGLVNRVASGFMVTAPIKHVLAAKSPHAYTGKLAHALRSDTLRLWVEGIGKPHLIPSPKPVDSVRGLAVYERQLQAINREIAIDPHAVFVTAPTLGYEKPTKAFVGLAYLTQEPALPSAISNGDDLRDVLGLHQPIDSYMLLLTFDALAIAHHPTARPTFADGGNSRFRVIPDNPIDNDWGTTVNLSKFQNGDPFIDGAPERVAEKIPIAKLTPEFKSIGWVKAERGTSKSDSDDAFQDRLLKSRTIAQIRSSIEDFLK